VDFLRLRKSCGRGASPATTSPRPRSRSPSPSSPSSPPRGAGRQRRLTPQDIVTSSSDDD
jgi:hypothetical protein